MSTCSHYDFSEYDELPPLVLETLLSQKGKGTYKLHEKENTHVFFYYMFTANLVLGGVFSPENVSKIKTCIILLS